MATDRRFKPPGGSDGQTESRWNAEKRYQIVKEALSQKEPMGQIAIRLGAKVSGWLRKAAGGKGLPHQLLVNEILASEIRKASRNVKSMQETMHIIRQSYRGSQYEGT
jgi:transposase-like protein